MGVWFVGFVCLRLSLGGGGGGGVGLGGMFLCRAGIGFLFGVL